MRPEQRADSSVVVDLCTRRPTSTKQTILGIALPGREGYPIRIPILPLAEPYDWDEPPAHIEPLGDNRVRVEVQLPREPTQIAVDPDQILVDRNPANNFWKAPIRYRFTPVYTFLEETDLTTAYDRWNVIVGPWIYGTAYYDAWYTRTTATMVGFRAGLYRTQTFVGGVYAGYRTDYRDVVAGVDGLFDHWPDSRFPGRLRFRAAAGPVLSGTDTTPSAACCLAATSSSTAPASIFRRWNSWSPSSPTRTTSCPST